MKKDKDLNKIHLAVVLTALILAPSALGISVMLKNDLAKDIHLDRNTIIMKTDTVAERSQVETEEW